MIFIWFTLMLGIFHSAHLYSNDTLLKIRSAQSLLITGSTAVEPSSGGWGTRGRGGKMYPNFVIGAIIMMIPPVLLTGGISIFLEEKLHAPLLSAVVSTQNVVVTAAAVTVLFLVLVNCGIHIKKAFIASSILLFSTEIFTYSSTGWSEPGALLATSIALLFLSKKGLPDFVAWKGFAVGIAFTSLIRIELMLFFLIFLCLMFFSQGFNKRMLLWPLCALVVTGTIHLGYNYYRFESLFNFGYFMKSSGSENERKAISLLLRAICTLNFTDPTKLKLLYLSFGRVHPFWAAPLLIAVPFYLRKVMQITPVMRNLFITAVLFFPFIGPNSWCWGNRYIYMLIPFLLIPILFAQPVCKKASLVLKIGILLGVGVSFSGKLINYHTILEQQVYKHGYSNVMVHRSQNIVYAPIWHHLRELPGALKRTMTLPAQQTGTVHWQQARKEYLDIWPVGLAAVGFPPLLAFCMWVIWTGVTGWYSLFIMKQMGFGRRRLKCSSV